MNVHEFQGKSLLKAYNVDIQEGFVAETPGQAVTIAKQIKEKLRLILGLFPAIHEGLA